MSLLTSIQARLYYPNIPGCKITDPPSGIDTESCSGADADASRLHDEELWVKT